MHLSPLLLPAILELALPHACSINLFTKMNRWLNRAAICPVFPGHVLFLRVKNSVQADFLNLAKYPGFWTIDHLLLFVINAMLSQSLDVIDFSFFLRDNTLSASSV